MKYQLAIIGGGPAGYTAAETAGKAGLSVILFEKKSLGGVCLNEGCIPTKTLLYSAKTYDNARHAQKYAVNVPEASFDLPKMIARKQKVVRKLVLGIKGKLTQAGVTMVQGEAQIVDAHHVSCGEEQYDDPDVIFRPILAFAREHRFVQKGTMWGSMLFVDCSGGVRRHYFDTYMTFE